MYAFQRGKPGNESIVQPGVTLAIVSARRSYQLQRYLRGASNQASGLISSVSGGSFNMALGNQSSVSGGNGRKATMTDDWVAGTLFEDN